jgi:N-acetylneuraminic acid mutarotase
MSKLRLLILCLPCFILLQSAESGCDRINLSDGTWKSVEAKDGSVPVERHEAAFVNVDEHFCLIGGRGMRPTSQYNAKTDHWTNGNPPPIEMHHFQPVVYQDKVYIMGALTGPYPGETPIENIYIYDHSTDSWEKGPEIPEDRRRGAAGVVLYKEKMYMVCGIKDGHRGDHKNWLDVYDPKTGKWEKLADAPRARDHFQAVVAEDKLYVLGGRRSTASGNVFAGTIGEVDVYDFKTQQWSTLPNNLPTLRAGTYALLLGQEIVVLGGESPTQEAAHAEMEALDIKRNTWRSLSPMIQGRHGTGVILYDDALYVASGSGNRGGGPELNTMECFSLK